MAHFSIISSQSSQVIFEGAPRYVGAYLKPGYLEFPAIGSPSPISWHVGDYVAYSRTGKTYRLYRTPQTVEQGARNRYGASFLYENVQFFDDSKQLEFCPFTDLVPGDNTIHFSTQNTVSFFGKPLNVAERLQACLEAQYGSGSWEIRIVTTTDADLLELLDTEVEFVVSGANCLEVLDKVYETWNGLGWIHTVENGVNVITIGASNVRTSANTTVPFAYDDGLVRVEKSIANADQIGTRLFAYGSMKNMDATYYRGLDIYNAESVDIEHLMIPLSYWGRTSDKPDARKAYIENATAIAALGLIPRTAYFDGTGDLPDIHPTIERMTIGEVYDAGGAGYIPNLSKWSRSQRIDEIVAATNPDDHGTSAEQGQKYAETISGTIDSVSETFIDHDFLNATIFSGTLQHGGKLTLKFGQNQQIFTLGSAWSPIFNLNLSVTAGSKTQSFPLEVIRVSSTSYYCVLPESVVVSGTSAGALSVSVTGYIGEEEDMSSLGGEGVFSTDVTTTVGGGLEYELPKTLTVTIPQIGFDIDDYAALGAGKTISMKTGMCAGRDFEIKGATYVSSDDSWVLTLYRSIDEDLNIMFPNADYEIAAGDQYVLLDIAMPEMYVTVASQRLLSAAQTLLADISVEQPFYAPQIDAKVVYNESRVLRDGMWMDISLDGDRQFVIIDSITIDENGSNIPTYEVALRESKGIEWTENVGRASSSKSSSSVNGGDSQQATGSVTSVGLAAPTGLEVEGSPVTGAGVLKLKLASGYKIPLESELASYFELGSPATKVQLKSAYSYIGTRKGLVFDTEADPTNSPAHLMVINKGTAQEPNLALYSPLPLITGGDQIVVDGTPGGGGGGGGATMLRQLDDVYHNASSVLRKNGSSVANGDLLAFDSSSNKWVALAQSTITPDLSDYYTKSQTDSAISTAISALNLGAAATYGIGSVTSGDTGLVTGGAVWSAIDALPEPMVFKGSLGTGGTITSLPVNGTASIGDTYKVITAGTYAGQTAKVGDTFICQTKTSSANTWVLIPSGDEPEGTVTSVGLSLPVGLVLDTVNGSASPITDSGTFVLAFQSGYAIPTTEDVAKGVAARDYFNSSGVLTYDHGGTGRSSAWTANGVIYASSTSALGQVTNVSGNSQKKFLVQTTNGSGVAQAPAWGSLAFSDLPTLYWANVQVSGSSSTVTEPTFASVRIGDAEITWVEGVGGADGYLQISTALVTQGDQIVVSGTPGGGGGGGATNLKELEDVYHNASGVRRYSSGNVGNTDLLGYDSTKGWYAVQLGTGLSMTNGVLTASTGSTYTAGYAIAIAQSAISVAHTNEDAEPISFDPDTHTGLDASNLVEWGTSAHANCAKLTVGVGSDSPVSKDLVLSSGYDYLLGLINSQVSGVSSVAGKTGAVTLEIADVTGLQTALNGKQAAGSYVHPTDYASANSAGVIKVGTGLSINSSGVLSATASIYTAGSGISISSGTISNTGVLSIGSKTGAITLGSNLSISSSGVLSATDTTYGYASATAAGLIKIGTGLTIDSSGVVSVTGQTQGTVTRVDVGSTQYSPSSAGVVSLPEYPTVTWRNVYTGGTSRVGTGTDTKAINFAAGTGITISYKAAGTGSGQSGSANYFNVEIGVTANTYQPLDADLTEIAALTGPSSGQAFLKRKSDNTWVLDTSTYLTSHQTLYNLVINNSAGTAQITYKPGTSGTYALTLTKAMVGLSDVENTALSTWAGTTNITTLGTITSGTWSASTIAVNKGGTGKTSWTQYGVVYASATTTLAQVSNNTTTTRKFLRQVGANNAATAPAWDTVTKTDVGLSNVPNWAVTSIDTSAATYGSSATN